MTNMAISADFLIAYANLQTGQQRGVRSLIENFIAHGTKYPSFQYEKIEGAKDPKMHSLRIGRGPRVIVSKPQKGDVYVLLWVGKHDDAYHWAERRRCDVNPESGALQVYLPQEDGPAEVAPAPAEPTGAFADLKDRELMRLGVPQAMLPEVRGIADEQGLESIDERLPVEVHDALFYYLAGDSYDGLVRERETPQTVDVADFTAALQRLESRKSRIRFGFAVAAADELELEAMLNMPLQHWHELEQNGWFRLSMQLANQAEGYSSHFDTREEHDAHLVECIGELSVTYEIRHCVVVAYTRAERDAAVKALQDGGFECAVLDGSATDDEQRGDAVRMAADVVRVATMHRVKGLEFDHVLLASANSGLVPLRNELALLRAAIRATRKRLTVLSFDRQSRFLRRDEAEHIANRLFHVSSFGGRSRFLRLHGWECDNVRMKERAGRPTMGFSTFRLHRDLRRIHELRVGFRGDKPPG